MKVSDNQSAEIRAADRKGMSRDGMTRALGVSMAQIEAVLGAEYEAATDPTPYSKDALRTLANEALHALLYDIKMNPAAFKPAEIIAAAREALDRTDGKARQEHELKGNAIIQIIGAIPAPHSQMKVIEHDPIEQVAD
jgi:hypothetical protein